MTKSSSGSAAPRLSIVMPVFNGIRFAKSTIESVLAQTFTDWELVVMDGGSTDGTLEVFRGHAARDPRISVFSEPDEGAWHAIYKAAKRARGELLAILCVSDGYVNKDWLASVVAAFDRDPDISLVWGIPFQMDEGGKLLGPNYLYAQFLEHPEGHRRSFVKTMMEKLDLRHPRRALQTLRRLRPENVRLAATVLRGRAAPQREDWFFYWLTTGQFFPDLNMCMYRNVFFDCVPPYVPGNRVVDEYMTFYYEFNTKGYLSACLPIPANYGRVHEGQYTDRVVAESDRLKRAYFAKIRAFRKTLASRKEMTFRDHNGRVVSRRSLS